MAKNFKVGDTFSVSEPEFIEAEYDGAVMKVKVQPGAPYTVVSKEDQEYPLNRATRTIREDVINAHLNK